MRTEKSKSIVTRLLSSAGVTINGQNPWDIQVHDDHFYEQALQGGSLAIGESYVANWWDCAQLDGFFTRILRAHLDEQAGHNISLKLHVLFSRLFNLQTTTRSLHNVERHYDIGNDLFQQMLDKRMVYSCAFWQGAHSLDEAQENKLDLSCRKLRLEPGMQVLDIGCGWGSFARFAAERYGVHVTGITISKEQAALAKERCKGLPVDIKLMDYRSLNARYDAIVSIGMFEHVGYKNYLEYMRIVHRSLKENGLFLLHTIGSNTSHTFTDRWINKYIFPNSMLPSVSQIGKAIEGLFVMEHWENFSSDYDKTLMAWYDNFTAGWDQLKHRYSADFFRMWKYYLLSCAATFRSRSSQLWQVVLSKGGVDGGYRAPAI